MRKLLPALLAMGAIIASAGVAHAGGTRPESYNVHVGARNGATTGTGTGISDSGPYSYPRDPDETFRSTASWDGASGFATGHQVLSGRSDGAGIASIALNFRLAEDDGHTYYRLLDAASRVECPLEGAETTETPPVTVEVDGGQETVSERLHSTVELRDGRVAEIELEKIVDAGQLRPDLIPLPGEQAAAGGWRVDVQVSDGTSYRYLVGVTHCASHAGPNPPVEPWQ